MLTGCPSPHPPGAAILGPTCDEAEEIGNTARDGVEGFDVTTVARSDIPGRADAAFSRVTVVAPRTRIDVALPTDVAVAELLPMLLDMAREAAPDGGASHGGWCLARLGGAALDPTGTLGSVGILDGELLQLRWRVENPPPPLFDDVVDAIAVSAPVSFRPWTPATARLMGHVAGGLALVAAAAALLLAGPGMAPALVAGLAGVATIAVGAVLTTVYGDVATGVVVAVCGPPFAFVCGLFVVPGEVGAANVLLASVLTLVMAVGALLVTGRGTTTFVALAAAAVLGSVAALVATLVEHPLPGIAAGAAAVAVGGISVSPRLTIQLAKLPLPQVPGSAEDLRTDDDFPDYAAIERRAGIAHDYLTGMLIGCGAVAAGGAVLAATGGAAGSVFGAVVAAVLLLRARSYANGSQAIALLASGALTATGLVVGWMVAASALVLLVGVFAGLLVAAAAAMVVGVVFPSRRFSPPLRRSVDIVEAVLIAAVLPLALAVMELYRTFRQL